MEQMTMEEMAKKYPLLAARMSTPFADDLRAEPMSVKGKPMPRAVWNIIITKRDLSLWCLHKMKPHRHWKVSDVKWYFGLTGNGQALLDRFLALKAEVDDLYGKEQS